MKFTETNVAFSAAGKIPVDTGSEQGYLTPIQLVLPAIQGAAGDPTRIGKEFMPDSMEIDYIVLGEAGEVELPQGGLTRNGNTLQMFDENGDPQNVVPDSIPAQENAVPYHRVTGRTMCVPFGVTGSTAKAAPNGTVWWQELGRVRVPREDMAAGKVLHVEFDTRAKSIDSLGANKRIYLIHKNLWDVPVLSTAFNSATVSTFMCAKYCATGSPTDVAVRTQKYYPITYGGTYFQFSTPVTQSRVGYTYAPTPAAIAPTDDTGTPADFIVPTEEMEFVVVVGTSATATSYFEVDYDVRARVGQIKPAAPTGLASDVVGTTVTLGWTDNATNEASYELFRAAGLTSSSEFFKIADIVANAVSYIDSSVPAGTWQYFLRAVAGQYDKSDFATVEAIVS